MTARGYSSWRNTSQSLRAYNVQLMPRNAGRCVTERTSLLGLPLNSVLKAFIESLPRRKK